ncbi:MAG: hypothetical protein Q8N51_03795, partial [Gammaproteobacteria bacterium]|nr:hypothetical protein [Gammaproteobacteria bacterium]
RVYLGVNVGTATNPAFSSFPEITDLSEVLPDRIEGKALKAAMGDTAHAGLPLEQGKSTGAKGASVSYNLGDIALYDWDFDGVLDFMFYDRTNGLTLVRNVGTVEAPAWNDTIGTDFVTYIYEHSEVDGLTFAEGTFAIRENPDSAIPGIEWTRDIFVSVNSRLKNYRFFTTEGENGAYRLNKVNAVAFQVGQGDVDFWDYDDDGDLDMFRTGVSSGAETNLILIENHGAPYAPAWAEFESKFSITDVPLNAGSGANDSRNDLFLFRDHDADGQEALFVQKLDGTIDYYEPGGSGTPGVAPAFTLMDDDFVESIAFGDIVTAPRGFAIQDFDRYADGQAELITAYSFQGDSTIRVVDILYRQILIDNAGDPSLAYYDLLDGTLPEDFLPDPYNLSQPLDPLYLEAMGSGDLNLDGRPDLVIAWSADTNYEDTEIHYYLNEAVDTGDLSVPQFRFVYGGLLDEAYGVDHNFGRMPKIVDIDGDGDNDLFIGHRYPDGHGSNLNSYLRFYRNIVDSGLDIYRTRLITN